MKQAITDEEVWLIKLLWLQGWSLHSFDPWCYGRWENRQTTGLINPVYESLEQLIQAAQLPKEEIEQYLDNFSNQGWLTSTQTQPFQLTHKHELLRLLVDCQANRARTAYKLAEAPGEMPVRMLSKRYAIPMFTWPLMYSRMETFAVIHSADAIGIKREEARRFDLDSQSWTDEVRYGAPNQDLNCVLHLLGQDFLFNEARSHSHPTTGSIIEELGLEACDEEDAHVLLFDSAQWKNSIARATSHMSDIPSVDFLQCFVDACSMKRSCVPPKALAWAERLLCGRDSSELPQTPSSDLTTR